MGTLPSQQLGLAELLADLSLVTDLGMGHEPESAMRTCLVATGLAHALSLPEAVAVEAYYTALLLHLGCTASAHEMALAFGDDIAVNAAGMRTTFTDPTAVLTTFLPGIAQGASPGTRLRLTAVAVLGSIKITMPAGARVSVSGLGVLGGRDVQVSQQGDGATI